MKPYKTEMSKALKWFGDVGIDRWNFAVLMERSMVGFNRSRERDEVMRSGSWGWSQNLQGRNVYMRPSRPGPWPVVFLDDLSPTRACAVARKYSALVVETSRGNCQVWIKTASALTEDERLQTQRSLCALIGADTGSVSGDHFGRAPGFQNRKPGRDNWTVRVIKATIRAALDSTPHLIPASISTPPGNAGGARVLAFPHLPARTSSPSGPRHQAPAPDGQREYAREFGWCLHVLRGARDCRRDITATMRELEIKLAAKALARGKRPTQVQAEKYARTVVLAARKCLNI